MRRCEGPRLEEEDCSMSETETTTGAAVATAAVAAAMQEHPEIVALREQGQLAVARGNEIKTITRMLDGMTWGNVRGSSLSVETRHAIARICQTYEADPMLHIHLLGGSVYLNAAYWAREINSLAGLTGWRQENVGPRYVAELREQARRAMQDAKDFEDPSMAERARALVRLAQQADERRAFYGIPDTAQEAYETIIEFSDRDPIREANYAPNSGNDPVGKARPAETARTRSMRRAAIKASPRVREAEEIALRKGISTEVRMIEQDRRLLSAGLPDEDGQAVRASGEPEGSNAASASELPGWGEERSAAQAATTDATTTSQTFDATNARKRYFATLREAGIAEEQRLDWQKKNKLPESTRDWGEAEYARAEEALVAPARAKYQQGCTVLGLEPDEFTHRILGALPDGLRDYKKLNAELDRLATAGDDDGESGRLL
jgi:hypothetical protein